VTGETRPVADWIVIIALLVAAFIFAVAVLVGCSDTAEGRDVVPGVERIRTCAGCAFELIYIDDMPCIKWAEKHEMGSEYYHRTYSGLSCDWSDR
jgi:hypothetical protein